MVLLLRLPFLLIIFSYFLYILCYDYYLCLCVHVVYMPTCVCVQGGVVCMCVQPPMLRGQRRITCILLYHFLLHSLETRFLTELIQLDKPARRSQQSFCLYLPQSWSFTRAVVWCGVERCVCVRVHAFILKIKLTSSCLPNKYFYLLINLPAPFSAF